MTFSNPAGRARLCI